MLPSCILLCMGHMASNNNPIPKVCAGMRRQSQKLSRYRGKRQRQENPVESLIEDHNTVLISCGSIKLNSHGGFKRSSSCTLEFPSTESFPLLSFSLYIFPLHPESTSSYHCNKLMNHIGCWTLSRLGVRNFLVISKCHLAGCTKG